MLKPVHTIHFPWCSLVQSHLQTIWSQESISSFLPACTPSLFSNNHVALNEPQDFTKHNSDFGVTWAILTLMQSVKNPPPLQKKEAKTLQNVKTCFYYCSARLWITLWSTAHTQTHTHTVAQSQEGLCNLINLLYDLAASRVMEFSSCQSQHRKSRIPEQVKWWKKRRKKKGTREHRSGFNVSFSHRSAVCRSCQWITR